jgi:hypothetical protein
MRSTSTFSASARAMSEASEMFPGLTERVWGSDEIKSLFP